MTYRRAPLNLLRVSASPSLNDPWLPDALHLRIDTHPDLGLAQTPALVTYGVGEAPFQRFDTRLLAPGRPVDWHLTPAFPNDAKAFTQRSDKSWRLAPGQIVEFSFPEGTAILHANIESEGGPIRVQGLVTRPDGLATALERTGHSVVVSGEAFERLRITADPREEAILVGISGHTLEHAYDPKAWGHLSVTRPSSDEGNKLRQALTANLLHMSQRLSQPELDRLRATAATGAMLTSTQLIKLAVPRAAMPALDGSLPTQGSDAARQREMFQMFTRLNGLIEDYKALLDAGATQGDEEETGTAPKEAGEGVTQDGAIKRIERIAIAAETPGGAIFFGKRLSLPLEGLPDIVPISVRLVFAIPEETFDRLGLERGAFFEDRAALMAAITRDPGLEGGALLPLFVPEAVEGPFVALETRIMVNRSALGTAPPAPLLTLSSPKNPFVSGVDAQRVLIRAEVQAQSLLVLDRTQPKVERLNPELEFTVKEREVIGDVTLHAPLLAGRDETTSREDAAPVPIALRDDMAPLATQTLRYRIAQSDKYGRWSAFGHAALRTPDRPLSAAPALSGQWLPNEDGSGRVSVAVPPPHEGLLAPGGLAIARLKLTSRLDSTGPVSQTLLPAPMGPVPADGAPRAEPLTATFDVPKPGRIGLPPRRVALSAVWLAADNVAVSDVGAVSLSVPDPSPPPPLEALPSLTPLSLPDMSGICRAELELRDIPEGVAEILIEAADEGGFAAALVDDAGLPESVVKAARALDELAERANALKAFETSMPETAWSTEGRAPVATGRALLSHRVNGIPEGLVALRLRSVDARGLESQTGPVAWFGLPSSPPLAAPELTIRAGRGATPEFTIEIARPAGPPPSRIRLRRSAVSQNPDDMIELPLIAVPEVVDPNDLDWPIVVTDRGATALGIDARLPAWTQVSYRAEARAAPRFSGAPMGAWTPVGPAATGLWSPPDAPSAPGLKDAVLSAQGELELVLNGLETWSGAMGGNRIELAASPEAALLSATSFPVSSAAQTVSLSIDESALAELTITQVDPSGRRSAPLVLAGDRLTKVFP